VRLTAKVKKVNATITGKGEDAVVRAQLVLEVEDPQDWQVDALIEAMKRDIHHDITIDEEPSR
jgi:hypothetical protein